MSSASVCLEKDSLGQVATIALALTGLRIVDPLATPPYLSRITSILGGVVDQLRSFSGKASSAAQATFLGKQIEDLMLIRGMSAGYSLPILKGEAIRTLELVKIGVPDEALCAIVDRAVEEVQEIRNLPLDAALRAAVGKTPEGRSCGSKRLFRELEETIKEVFVAPRLSLDSSEDSDEDDGRRPLLRRRATDMIVRPADALETEVDLAAIAGEEASVQEGALNKAKMKDG